MPRHELFSAPWCEAWKQALADSDSYRKAGENWSDPLILVEDRDAGAWAGVRADLHHGVPEAVRPATAADLESCPFVLAAPTAIWRRVLEGELDPLWALMSKRIAIRRGALRQLARYPKAARELVLAARQVPTAWAPDDATVTADLGAAVAALRSPARRQGFQTTSAQGLDRGSAPMKLWEKAKRLGVWNPSKIDLDQDRKDWLAMAPEERDLVLRLISLFQGGEEAVAIDLLPLIQVIAAEGRLEEEMYLTSFLWEEAKHVDLFRRFLDEVCGAAEDLSKYHTPAWKRVFHEALPQALGALAEDRSPVAQARASATYNMIVEGVLAETGYHAFGTMLTDNGLMPGMVQAVHHLKLDESRHIAYGMHLLGRLVGEYGAPIWQVIEDTMEELLDPALAVIDEAFACYEVMPFGLEIADFTEYSMRQFQSRLSRLQDALGS